MASSGPTRPRRVSAADVAKAAGVSATTVSYVLNNRPHQSIPETTRQRVIETAGRLGYAPSPAARALASGRSNLVLGIVADWPVGDNAGQITRRLTAAFAHRGYAYLSHTSDGDAEILWRTVTPAAVVVFGDIDDQQIDRMHAAGVGVVIVAWTASGTGRGEFEQVEHEVGRQQAEHLISRGHRQLGYAWPDDPRLVAFARPRLAGVEAACSDAGISLPDVRTVNLDEAVAAATIAAWRETSPAVTAVCAYNDETAIALLKGLGVLRLSCPTDLAVIGVDDLPVAALITPSLTTINFNRTGLTDQIAMRVTDAIAGTPTSCTRTRFAQLITVVERATT